ncbi:aldehyde dehydrogenase family protein [Nocardioides pacificus]
MNARTYDTDLRSIQEARDLAVAAREAHRRFQFAEQPDVDRICAAMAEAAFASAERLGQLAHDETGYGVVLHKKLKNEFASRDVWESIKDTPTCGVLRRDEENHVVEIGWPVGVIAALSPSTNPTSTAIFKVLIAVKARNAVVVAPHPSSVECTFEAVRVMAQAGEAAGMPAGLVSCLRTVTLPGSHELMSHYATSMVLATGGTSMVKAAHSVGKPALGVGPGNVPVYVDRSADVEQAAADIVSSKAFDHSTICASEQAVVADRPIAGRLRAAMTASGAHWLTPEQADRLGGLMFRPGGLMDARFVGRSPQRIGEIAGFDVPASARVLVADLGGVGPAHPLSREKLTTVLGFIEEDGWHRGCERAIELLRFGGDGHSLVIHARDEEAILAFGIQKPAFRILVNTWGSLGAIGATTGLTPSMTLSPGGLGGAVVSDNIGVRHLLNVKRLAYEVRRPPAEAWGHPAGASAEVRPNAVPFGAGDTGFDPGLIARVVREVLAQTQAEKR